MPRSQRWMLIPRAVSEFIKRCNAWDWRPGCWWLTRLRFQLGGMVSFLTPFCWMRPVLRLALCGGTPTCAGCGASQTSPSWSQRRPGCSKPCGKCSSRVAGSCIAPVPFSERRAGIRYKRFLHTTPKPVYCLRPGIYCKLTGRLATPSRTIQSVTMTAFITHCLRNARLDLIGLLACTCLVWGSAGPARAQTRPAEISSVKVERAGDAIVLSASVQFDLSTAVEDALLKGVAMIFVAEADILRER